MPDYDNDDDNDDDNDITSPSHIPSEMDLSLIPTWAEAAGRIARGAQRPWEAARNDLDLFDGRAMPRNENRQLSCIGIFERQIALGVMKGTTHASRSTYGDSPASRGRIDRSRLVRGATSNQALARSTWVQMKGRRPNRTRRL